MEHYINTHQDLKTQPKVSKALFPKDNVSSRDIIQKKLVTIIKEKDKDIILAAPII